MAEAAFTYQKATLFRRLFLDPIPPSKRAGWLERSSYVFFLAAVLTVLYLSVLWEPSSTGFGTHTQQMGGKCTMIQLVNCPCPFCGMTTSFTNMAKGRFPAAVRAQPFGVPFFILFLGSIPVLAYGAARGYKIFQLAASRRFDVYLDVYFALLALAYSYKILMFIYDVAPRA